MTDTALFMVIILIPELTGQTFYDLPDRTVYEIDRGSYFVSYNSFKQTRTPVTLMYYKKK